MAETFNFCLVVKLDRVRQGINATAAVRAALLLGLFVAETLAARDDQVLMRLVTPRSLGSKLSQKSKKTNIRQEQGLRTFEVKELSRRRSSAYSTVEASTRWKNFIWCGDLAFDGVLSAERD